MDETRRSFLKAAGFTLFAGCSRGLDRKAIPLLVKAEEILPGKSVWYASLCGGCPAGCGILAKNRDGRPVKIEGNPEHRMSQGGLCAAGQAGVLSLYDSQRLKHPLVGGKEESWESVDGPVRQRLGEVKEASGRRGAGAVRFLTGTVNGPTQKASIDAFLKQFRDGRHVSYDAVSASALLDAHEALLGRRAVPRYRFDKATVIVGFDADFLGTWISPVEYTKAYRKGRDLSQEPVTGTEPAPPRTHSHHVQFEGHVSITGSNADLRVPTAPEEIGLRLAQLGELLSGETVVDAPDELRRTAERLKAATPGTTLVLCGANDIEAQRLAIQVNQRLGNIGATLDLERPSYQRTGDDKALAALREEIDQGKVGALFIAGCNPQYDLDEPIDLSKVELVVSFAERVDETAEAAHFVCPDHHFLESWSDAEAVDGLVTVSQPAIKPLGDTRSLVETLAAFSGRPAAAREIMREHWRRALFARQSRFSSFERFWIQAVHDGVVALRPRAVSPVRMPPERAIRRPAPPTEAESGYQLVLYEKAGMRDGRHAHNPWLHELPDPVTKIVWDNYAQLSPAAARALGVASGDLVDVDGLKLPAHVQPGQHDGVVAIAVGYGRKGTDRFSAAGPDWIEGRATVERGERVGVNAFRLRHRRRVAVKATGGRRELACTQKHHDLKGRPIVQHTTVGALRKDPHAGAPDAHPMPQLWSDDHKYTGYHWGMAIDLSACTGCSACVVGCQAENNIPVVGKDEVRRQREMHWIRIDRYETDAGPVHQPMMCQQCDNAPCESVCPVLATVHSSEGLNQQIYNRCVGTRYCANNCPYKVRRFNWFDYRREDTLQNMVLNPDVVVRTRGVMEKCSFCVQRIQEAKAESKREGRPLKDGEISPACVQSCPADAIVFGDLSDPGSAVAKARANGRHYHVLGELNTQPTVGYMRLVRNTDV